MQIGYGQSRRSWRLFAPDVLVTTGAAPTRALQQATQIIPIVFTGGGDAAANGLVKNIARPEGNTTGFSSSEPTAGGKWLELLKEAAPRITRVAIVFNPEVAPTAPNYIVAIEQAARTLSVQTLKAPFRDTVELVRAIDDFAREPNGGLLMLPPPAIADRISIIKLAAQHRLPAIYPQRALAAEGGLISYGADPVDQNRRAATYKDRHPTRHKDRRPAGSISDQISIGGEHQHRERDGPDNPRGVPAARGRVDRIKSCICCIALVRCVAHLVRYCGASECRLSGCLRKWFAHVRNVKDDP